MSRALPILLQLPRRAMLTGTNLAVLAHSLGDFRSPPELERRFGLHSHEHHFVAELLRTRPQVWVFRCDQLLSCGDFVFVDMSAPRALRRCTVLEHKQRTRLRESRHYQLENRGAAVDEVVRRRLVEPGAQVSALFGSADPRELQLS
ncbi:MAG: hypothetical protein JNK82_35730 [Myxococcaceae bacterium]|nr:hypothetical protein [Myxococcaceae bacterium]